MWSATLDLKVLCLMGLGLFGEANDQDLELAGMRGTGLAVPRRGGTLDCRAERAGVAVSRRQRQLGAWSRRDVWHGGSPAPGPRDSRSGHGRQSQPRCN